MHLKPVN